jgi:hypothetical protein
MRKILKTLGVAVVGVLLAIAIYSVLPVRTGYCRRCGMGLLMRGPFVGGQMGSGLSELGGPSASTYCEKHGHVFTNNRAEAFTLKDWEHERDAYDTEADFRAANPATKKK